MSNLSKIFVAGKTFDCDAKVVTWHDSGWDSTADRCIIQPQRCAGGILPYSEKAVNTRARRYWYRPGLGRTKYPDLKAAQSVVRMFTVHHDGCPNAEVCFQVLHDERGLSCHFIIDNDGTIYQGLDLALMGFQAGGFNAHSIGVELCNRGDAKKYAGYYETGRASRGAPRSSSTVKVHGHTYLAYNFNDVQFEAFKELARALRYALPNMPVEYPQDKDKPGQQAWGEIPNPTAFSGYMGHYHQTLRKWDPGPFDFKKFCESVRGQPCFPVYTKKMDDLQRRPEIPEDTDELIAETKKLYQFNDAAQGGFFPVAPYGETRLWHGGAHLVKKRGEPVFAPFPGLIVAARMGRNSPVGSTNFVLMRHDTTIGENSIRFFTLYFHLDSEKADDKNAPEWLKSKEWKADLNKVQLLGEPVQAGTLLGHVGEAGPPNARGAQLHFEVFSRDEFVTTIEMMGIATPNLWKVVDGTTGGRFCDNEALIDLIDAEPKDGKFSRRELGDFFRGNPMRKQLHYYAVLHQSEWIGPKESWMTALKTAPEFQSMKDDEVERYVDEQVVPTLWWDNEVARHARLPRDGIVYHFHPITFVRFINEKLMEASAEGGGIGDMDVGDAKVTPDGVTDDREDESGSSFLDLNELKTGDDSDDWPLDKLVEGFPE